MKLLNVVLFAENYQALIDWYKDVLALEVIQEESGEYSYAELGIDKQLILGITPAKEVNHVASSPRNNSSVMQLEVAEIHSLFNRVKEKSGEFLFGPTADEKYGFLYGAISDIEGNQIWIVEGN